MLRTQTHLRLQIFEVVKGAKTIMNFINFAIIITTIKIERPWNIESVSLPLRLLKLDPEKLS